MTSTLSPPQSPTDPGRPRPARTPVPPGRPERRSRRWLLGFWGVVLVGFLVPSPGRMTFETKLGVVTDPWRFLGDLGELWHDRAGFGGIADQYVGYAFPMLPYHALTDLLGLPVWMAERLWLSLVVTAAFWGALRLAERFGVGTSRSRLLGAACYALWPTFTIVVGSTSAAALPGAMLPWVLLPLTSTTASPRVAAARSALLIPFMGGVNAASTLASLLPVGLYLLSRTGRRRRALIAWWTPGVLLATVWWVVPLLLLGGYGEDFMPYVEQAETTTGTMAATEMLRGAGNWTAYLFYGEPWLPAGWTMATGVLTIAGSALAAALGLAGLARRDLPERRWLVLTAVVVAAVTLAGYAGALGGPFAPTVQGWLDGWLRPFRNIYKFQPGLALTLAFGLAHLVGVAARRAGSRGLPARRLLPGLAALLVLPGLALPFLRADVLQPGAFEKLPRHWQQTADWLEEHAPESRAYVTPATAHGIHTWGSPIDDPLHVLAESPWAQRDFVPFGTPGNRRGLDAVERAMASGTEVPGLSAYLARAGLHHVVVRNDLDPDQVGYVPPQTVERTLQSSGYERVAAFGPKVTAGRIAADTPLDVAALYPRPQAVEIYRPTGVESPGRVTARAVSETASVSGGPESLLPLAGDPRLAGRPAVLTGDAHPGLDEPALQVRGDGLRLADTRFGLLNHNTSAVYTPGQRNPPDAVQDAGEPPKQILPVEGVRHQTTAALRGAESVTASSSGNWLFHLPQFEPVHAFDGDPDTAWAEGSAAEPVGQWVQVDFDGTTDVPPGLEVTPLPGDQVRATPTRIRVTTEQGSEESPLRPDGSTQRVRAPAGPSDWLRVTLAATESASPGLTGAGFAEIAVPDVRVEKLLRLPRDASDTAAAGEIVSLHRAFDSGGLLPVAEEGGAMNRRFATGTAGDWRMTATARAVPGDALDALLARVAPEQRVRITATAESTSRLGATVGPRSLVDGDLTTAWIAGDDPTVRLRWEKKTEIDRLVLAGAGGITSRPTEVRISSPDGAATVGVDENGWVRFDPITTDALDLTVTATEDKTVHNPFADRHLQLPVGLTEVHVPALEELRTPPPDPDERFSLPCGDGPRLEVDGTRYRTKASGTVADLVRGREVDVELCADGLALQQGRHTVRAGGDGPLAVTGVALARGTAADVPGGSAGGAGGSSETAVREVTVEDWSGDSRTVRVGDGAAAYLQTFQNVNEGWRATLNGEELTPLRLDGWQQGFLVPEGGNGLITLEYEPAPWYTASLFAGGAGIAVLLGLALFRRRAGEPLGEDDPAAVPRPSWVLGTLVLTSVMVLVSGPYALVVPALALVARFRTRLLVPLALVAMAGAGVAAVVGVLGGGPGIGDGEGAFGTVAQALALLALSAALVTLPARHESGDVDRRERSDAAPDGTPPPPGPGRPGGDPPTRPMPTVPGGGFARGGGPAPGGEARR
ncbi:alpha-(1-_3)-arabinofuranosyltransferase family protein [Streptomyces sp. DSM 42041]|uniref:Alpha-(1->3)-arabinofuranosyltransferase family protein n=1 Tax=Streptomyces hazeniae TaxID=3075538 RepID=A0ABU2NK31_9ACTN|nr:alpha-(1->3)-arabinofuranosyltransferase family protein [Streptomyces sp. DSM 42041]MDT0377356.1 alpha-(1->3)-arabinofuranosyltransferase family protein [Streptomyces sp. DSM 42041]